MPLLVVIHLPQGVYYIPPCKASILTIYAQVLWDLGGDGTGRGVNDMHEHDSGYGSVVESCSSTDLALRY
jgi:hypothetical protein